MGNNAEEYEARRRSNLPRPPMNGNMVTARSAFFAVGAAVFVLLAGCAPEPQTDTAVEAVSEPSVDATAAIASTRDIRLPLDAYSVTYREWSALALAEARLTKKCAERFGVEYEVSPGEVLRSAITPYTFDAGEARHAYRFYHNDLAAVRSTGYVIPLGLPHDLEEVAGLPEMPPENDRYRQLVLNGLEPGPTPLEMPGATPQVNVDYRGAYPADIERPTDGDGGRLPDGGCSGEARSILAGDGELHNLLYANDIGGKAYFRAIDDSRVREVTQRWSECMAERGYDYANPDEAGGDPKWLQLDAAQRPIPEEIIVATADVECKQSVNYLGVRVAVETAYQNLVIEEHFQDLERNYRNAQEMLRRANEWSEVEGK